MLPNHLSQLGHPLTYLDACLATEPQAAKLFFTGLEKEAPVVDSVDLHACAGILIVHWDAAGTEEGVYLGLLGKFGSGDGKLVVGEPGERRHCGFLLVWLDMGRRVTEKPGHANGESLHMCPVWRGGVTNTSGLGGFLAEARSCVQRDQACQ